MPPSQLLVLLLVGTAVAQSKERILLDCDTTVQIADGKIVIELWPWAAPIGVQRVLDMAEVGFFDDLPFFRAISGFLAQFGISPDPQKQAVFNQMGNIKDDAKPDPAVPFTAGVMAFAGYGEDSRSTQLFLTLGNQPHLGKSPWEVPVGQVVSGLDVMKGIYTGYSDTIDQTRLRLAAGPVYTQYPKLDRFKGCTVRTIDEMRDEL